uniref:ATP-binding cassette sub-family F member 3 isoform X2 n=1 Tax=Myxine glutinosa TaxID=7769 RepID=UPI00358FC8F0
MEACVALLRREFPSIDVEVFDYVKGVLEGSSEEFQGWEDVFEAVGGFLQEGCEEARHPDDIQDVCQQLFDQLNVSGERMGQSSCTLLNTPIQLSDLARGLDVRRESGTTIMEVKKEPTMVEVKRLEKAEAKLRAKQERRTERDCDSTPNLIISDQATASQAINKREVKLDASGKNKTYDVRLENFDLAFGERVLLCGADLLLVAGRRYGLVGRNGLGKTTLLKMISSGGLRIPRHMTVLHVEQEVAGDATLALASVLQADEKRERLIALEQSINAELNAGRVDGSESSQLALVYAKLEEIEADKAPARASVILAGLGFDPKMQQRPTREFSGGWRMRLALARALFSRPDLLLLDEPTNMLDVRAILWLENYLQTWPSTLLVVSHDRNFLNSVATDIVHLHSRRLDMYRGNFENFDKAKEEKLKSQQREYDAQQQYRDHIQVFIDRFRCNANRAAQVQSKLKLLEKLPELKPIDKEQEVVIRLPDGFERLSPPVLQLDTVSFHYDPDKCIFNKINLSLDLESRVCIVGENGTGKTTLLKLLLGDLSPISGIRHAHRNLKLGYFSQHHVDQLTMHLNAVQVLASHFPGSPEESYRQQLGRYGVSGELALRPVATLSGGQKSRVAFALITMASPNLYVLDEPTNHLDMETIEALGKSLCNFQGGVVLVSHDERLICSVCKELWVCGEGGVQRVDGGFQEYKGLLEEQFRKEGFT